MNITHGDQYNVECPECGEMITDLWDLGNSLHEGAVISCGSCDKEILVERLDMVVYITLSTMQTEVGK